MEPVVRGAVLAHHLDASAARQIRKRPALTRRPRPNVDEPDDDNVSHATHD